MKQVKFLTLALLSALLLSINCSTDRPTQPSRTSTAMKVSFLESSLEHTVRRVALQIAQNDAIVHRDTVNVTNGQFSFGQINLSSGSAAFSLSGLDSVNHAIYTGDTTAVIAPGVNTTVVIQLMPSVPMVKLSPYYSSAVFAGVPFKSTLEVYDIARLSSGLVEIVFDNNVIRFDSVRAANTAWGPVSVGAEAVRTHLAVNFSRQGNSDLVPANAPELVEIWFTPISGGVTTLTMTVQSLLDIETTIPELSDSRFVADGQTLSIQSTGTGSINGRISNALTGLSLDSVYVYLTGPTQRSLFTDTSGLYQFAELPYGSYNLSVTRNGYIGSNRAVELFQATFQANFIITPILDTGQYRVVLSWGATPHDLDAHLWTLGDEIYFANKGSLDTIPYVLLDIDQTMGYGPETITIGRLSDTCKYAVYNYSTTPAITTSTARVDLYKGSALMQSFSVPTTGTGLWWYVFDLTPSGALVVKNVITDTNPGTAFAKIAPKKAPVTLKP